MFIILFVSVGFPYHYFLQWAVPFDVDPKST